MTDHTVYIYRDSSRRVLYVGVTGRGHRRAEEHAATKEWWCRVDNASFFHVASREHALDLERTLIETLAPVGNTQHYREPEIPFVPPVGHARLQRIVRGEDIPAEVWFADAGVGRKERTRAWMSLPRDVKYAIGCITCGREREKHWAGAQCPECYATAS